MAVTDHVKVQKPVLAKTQTEVARGMILSKELMQTAAGSEQVSLLEVDLTNPTLCLGVVQANDRLISPDETVSSMAERTGALAGINGDYFEFHGPGRPISIVVRNGQLLQSPNVYPALGVTSSGWLTIGVPSFSGQVSTARASYALTSVNVYNDARKGLVLITPALGASIAARGDTVAFMRPVEGEPETYTVEAVKTNITELSVLPGQYALLASGDAGKWLANNLVEDMDITVTEHLSPDSDLVQAIGGGPWLVRDGAAYNDPNPPAPHPANAHNPLTAAAVTRDGTHALFAVFDGRFAGAQRSRGMTNDEAAGYMLAHGAFQAMLLDGGGSSEMVARLSGPPHVSVVNSPSDGRERPVANGLFVYSTNNVSARPACGRKSALHSIQAS